MRRGLRDGHDVRYHHRAVRAFDYSAQQCGILLFMIAADSADIQKEYNILLNELKQYNPELLHKERLLAITKSDMLDDELKAAITKELPTLPHLFISSVAQQGLMELKDLIWKHLNND